MITRLLCLVALMAGMGSPLRAYITVHLSAPISADAGTTYYVDASCSGEGFCNITLYRNGEYAASSSGYDSAYLGGYDGDYTPQTIEYCAYAWDDYDYTGTYAWVTINPVNAPPTIQWTAYPASVAVGDWYYVAATGYDSDGNLSNVMVDHDGSPFAYAGGGNLSQNESGNNAQASSAGWTTFTAIAYDSAGGASDLITLQVYVSETNNITYNYTDWPGQSFMGQGVSFFFNITNSGSKYWGESHYLSMRDWNGTDIYYPWLNGWTPGTTSNAYFSFTAPSAPGTYNYYIQALEHMVEWFGPGQTMSLQVVNRPPDSPTISSGGVTQINLGNTVSLTGTLHDPDGALAMHNLYYAAPGGSWTEILSGTPSDATSSTLTGSFSPTSVGLWQFLSNGHDGYDWGPGATLSVNVVDGTAPLAPTNLFSSNVITTSFTLNWTAPTDNVGVTGYEVMRDATSVGFPTTTTLAITGLTQGTTYAMKVRARDAAGNWSAWSSLLSVNTPDTQAPSVPGGLSPSSVTATSFTLGWSASSDNLGVTGYEVMRDSTSLGTTSGLSLAITGLTQGTAYSMKVRARDAAGNWSAWSSVSVVNTADTQAPSVPGGLASSNVLPNSFTLGWATASDNVGVTGYEVRKDSSSLGTVSGASLSVTGLTSNTTYAMTVRARDAAGNWSAWSSTLNVTTQPPTSTTDSDGDGVTDQVEALLGTNPSVAAATEGTSANQNELNIHRPTNP